MHGVDLGQFGEGRHRVPGRLVPEPVGGDRVLGPDDRRADTQVGVQHREAVAQALRDRGLRVRENVGLSKFRIDIAVGPSGSDEWTTAILLDGPGWAARTTSNDRDVLPPAVLRMMGWPSVKRIWLPAWQEEHDRILDEIEEAETAIESFQSSLTPPPDALY